MRGVRESEDTMMRMRIKDDRGELEIEEKGERDEVNWQWTQTQERG